MFRATRAALPALMVVFILWGCSPTSSAPEATEQPSPSAGWTRFTSERFGFSVELPGEWRYRPATEDWPQGVYPAGGAAYTDNFEQPPATFPVLDVSTQALADGMTPVEFLAWLDLENAKNCTVESTEAVSVDGVEGRLQRQTCGYNAWEVAVIDGEQVYLIYWIGEPSQIDAERPTMEQVIASFRFP